MYHRLTPLLLCLMFAVAPHNVAWAQFSDQIFLVYGVKCGPKQNDWKQTGFRTIVQGQVGLVTALHGVAGCKRIDAFLHLPDRHGGAPAYIRDLKLGKISRSYDAAFLFHDEVLSSQGVPLSGTSGAAGALSVRGYPDQVVLQLSHPLSLHDPQQQSLALLFGASSMVTTRLDARNSPSVQIPVILFSGAAQPGYSGAPILTPDQRVLGVVSGGLPVGSDISWAVKFNEIQWRDINPYNPDSDPDYHAVARMDASMVFAATVDSSGSIPETGATVTGRILYNGQPAVRTTSAYATISLIDIENWTAVPVDFDYSRQTGDYVIRGVPAGKYLPSIRLETGYPFNRESGGDYTGRISGMNPNIVVAPHSTTLSADLSVVQQIHLQRPLENQELRVSVADTPETLYENFYHPTAEVFQWELVPGATRYDAQILTIRSSDGGRLNTQNWSLNQPYFSPGLAPSMPGTEYNFSVQAYGPQNQLLGVYRNYYTDGDGGWLEFRVLPGG